MKIAEVLLRRTIGGAESLVESLRRHWTATGHTVEVLYLEDSEARHSGRLARVRGLAATLRAFDPDVVHAHSALPNLYARLSSRGRWPTVTVLHSAGRDFDVSGLRIAERMLGPWTSHVVAVSPAQVTEYRARVGQRVPVTLVPNGVRPDIVARSTPSARPSRAVAVGRLDSQKRVDLLLDGWRRAGLAGVELRVAGVATDPGARADVARWAAAAPEVAFLGAVGDIPGLLAGSDLFIHAATAEAHPLAPLEAACAGLPVVVSRPVSALLPDGLPAATFAAGDPDSLAAALCRAVANYPAAARRAIEQAPKIAAVFSTARCAAQHLQILQDAAAAS